jgi:TetR/AcrR family transcriptional regulator
MKVNNTSEQAIISAAEKEFLEKGFAAAKTTNIAAKAGVTHAMLHYYFRTKENIFNKIYEQKVEMLAKSVMTAFFNLQLPTIERIKKGIESHFDFLAANPSLPRFVINEIITNPERLQKLKTTIHLALKEVLQRIQDDLDAAAERGEIRHVNAIDLIFDAVSLNVFLFIMYPIATEILLPIYGSEKKMLEARKAENIQTLLNRLKPEVHK